jgi:hypothetical protein
MNKFITAVTAAAMACSVGAASAQQYSFKAMGQPVATGLIQKNVEQPFFENFAERTGIDAAVDYKPLDVTGIKDTEQLRILKAGLFDIVSLRLSQVSRDEPTILGLDLVGLNPDYDTGRKTVAAFKSVVDKQLQEKFNTKLLGVWPFGPQVLFCEPEIAKLGDLKRWWCSGADRLRGCAAVSGPWRGRLCHHGAKLGQFRRLARGDQLHAAGRISVGAERLWHEPEFLEQADAGRSGKTGNRL